MIICIVLKIVNIFGYKFLIKHASILTNASYLINFWSDIIEND